MKVALVTGASRGLGAAMAASLARAGWAVAINYSKDAQGADRVAGDIASNNGRADIFRFDIRESSQITDAFQDIRTKLGPVDLIVNNATGPQGAAVIADQDWATYLMHLEYFVRAPLLLLQVALPDWRARRSGRVINIGSEVTQVGNAYDAHYVAAKSAMLGLTRSWASELGPEGINVNMVSPGWTPVERHASTPPEEIDRHMSRVPLGRMGRPEDVSAMVTFLASDAASYITGQNIVVNGGHTFS
ncbi:MAG: SDR family oxidoreductase [Devosia sp.]